MNDYEDVDLRGKEWEWEGEERNFNIHDRMCIKIGIDLDKRKNINCFAVLVSPDLNHEKDMRLIDIEMERPLKVYQEQWDGSDKLG